jgi:hypothetical protein
MPTHAKKPEPKAAPPDAPADDVDVVAVVTRNADGSPAPRPGFVLHVPEDPTDAELAAAWNDNGKLPPAEQPVRYHPRGW